VAQVTRAARKEFLLLALVKAGVKIAGNRQLAGGLQQAKAFIRHQLLSTGRRSQPWQAVKKPGEQAGCRATRTNEKIHETVTNMAGNGIENCYQLYPCSVFCRARTGATG
jgi:hypothetical protein